MAELQNFVNKKSNGYACHIPLHLFVGIKELGCRKPNCKKTFDNEYNRNQHEDVCGIVKEYKCEYCPAKQQTKSAARTHRRTCSKKKVKWYISSK